MANAAYIHLMDNQALCAPALSLATLSDVQHGKLLSLSQTQSEWERDFKCITEVSFPTWLQIIEEEEDPCSS